MDGDQKQHGLLRGLVSQGEKDKEGEGADYDLGFSGLSTQQERGVIQSGSGTGVWFGTC